MSVTDLSGLIADFSTGTYAVTRATGPGEYDDRGIFTPDSDTTINVDACVVPLGGSQLQRLPEGLRSSELRQVFSAVELRSDAPGQKPDVISIDGHLWQVVRAEPWTAGTFFCAIVSKQP